MPRLFTLPRLARRGRDPVRIDIARSFLAALCLAACTAVVGVADLGATTTQEESRAYVEDALGLIARGDLKAAVIQLKNAVQQDPSNAQARELLGKAYIRLGDGASAEKELRRAISLGVSRVALAQDLGRALLLQGKFRDVLEEIDADVDGDERGEVLLLRGDAHLGLRDVDAAQETYLTASEALPRDPRPYLGQSRIALLGGDRTTAETHVDRALDLSPSSLPALTFKAELRRMANDLEAARLHFARAVEVAPDSPIARLGLAAAELALGHDEKAEGSLSVVEERFPTHPMAVHLRAVLLTKEGRPEDALQRLEDIGPALDSYLPGLLLRGALRYERGHLDLAIADLKVAMARVPNSLPARKLLAAAYLKEREAASAVTLLEGLDAQLKEDPQIAALLGTAYLQAGKAAEGLALLERAIAASPGNPEILRQFAIGSLASGDSTRAISALESSLDLGADPLSTGLLLGLARLNRNDPAGALEMARRLQDTNPNNPIGWNLAGGALFAQGKVEEARHSFQGALDIDSGFEPARLNLAQVTLASGDPEEAKRLFRAVLTTNAKNLRAHIGVARAALAQRDREGAAEALDGARTNAERAAPNLLTEIAVLYGTAGAGEKALATLQEGRRRYPQSPQIRLALARLQASMAQYEDAVASYEAVVPHAPTSADLQIELARTLVLAQQDQSARQALERALELDPGAEAAYDSLAKLELKLAGLEPALAVAARLRASKPDGAEADLLAGDLYRLAQRPQDSLAAFEAAWQRRKSQGAALGRHQALWSLGDRPAAFSALNEWLEESPSDLAVRTQLAHRLLETGDQGQAIPIYESVLRDQPDNAVILNNLAFLYLENDGDRALDMARRAHLLVPNSPEIMDTLGWVLVRTGAPEEALPLLEAASQAVPTQRDIAYHLAVALDATGQSIEARGLLKDLLADKTAFASRPEAEALLERLSVD